MGIIRDNGNRRGRAPIGASNEDILGIATWKEKNRKVHKENRKCPICKRKLSIYNPHRYCFAHLTIGLEKECQEEADGKIEYQKIKNKLVRDKKRGKLNASTKSNKSTTTGSKNVYRKHIARKKGKRA